MRVLLLGAGGPAAVGVANSLRKHGGFYLIGANCDKSALLHANCDETHVIPRAGSEDHRQALFGLCQRRGVEFAWAQPDEEVLALSKLRTVLKLLGTRTFLPQHQTLELCADKWESYKVWKRAEVLVPSTALVKGRTDLWHAIHIADAPAQEVWLRKRRGAGGAGSLRTKSYNLAIEWLNHHKGWGEFTVAQALTEHSVTWQSVWWRGKLVVSQQRKREKWANARNAVSGVGGTTGVGETCSDGVVEAIAEHALLAIDPEPHGVFGVDMTYDHDGIPNPTEINAGRFFTTIEFFTQGGFNFPVRVAGLAKDQPRELDRPCPVRNPLRDGLKWVRTMDQEPLLVEA